MALFDKQQLRYSYYADQLEDLWPIEKRNFWSPWVKLVVFLLQAFSNSIFTARRTASAVTYVIRLCVCPTVCLSVCPLQVGVLSKRLNMS